MAITLPAIGQPEWGDDLNTALSTLDTSVTALQTLTVNVKDYGAKGDGTTDDTAAINSALAAALSANPTSVVSGQSTNRSPVVLFPAGTYKVTSQISVDLAVTASPIQDRRRLTLQGGEGGSTILVSGTSGPYFYGGFLTIQGLRFIGASATGPLLKLGNTTGSTFVNQFRLADVQFHVGAANQPMTELVWVFDGSFEDVHWHQIGTGGSALKADSHPTDNHNNLSFRRCHWEYGQTARMVWAPAPVSSSTSNGRWSFDGCHFETQSHDTSAIDLEGATSVAFAGCQFTGNNGVGVATPAQAVSLIRLVACQGVSFNGCNISRSTASGSYAHKLFSLGGIIRSLVLTGCIVLPNDTGSNHGLTSIYESDATTALTAGGTLPIHTVGTVIGSQTRSETFPAVIGVQTATTNTEAWTRRVDPTTKQLIDGYGAAGDDITSARSDLAYLGNDGVLYAKGGYTGQLQNLANDGIGTFTFTANNNSNRRGVYLVYSSTTGNTWALVWSTGAALTAIATGADAAVGTANPDAVGKMNVYLSGTSIAVKNRFGSPRDVVVVPFGF